MVLRFTKCYWFNFEYASDRLKKDRRFVKTVIENDPFCFIYADDILKSDKKYIMELIKISNAQILHHASKEIREILFEHLKQPAIDYLKNELKKRGGKK